MSTPTPPLDIVTVMIAAATWAIGSEAAQYVGPYSVIILGAIGGATWSASSRQSESRWQALRYVLWMVGLALIATVPLAELIARWTEIAPRWIFAPVAVVVAARPDWVIRQAKRFITSRSGEQP
jgi:hypothetical protein